MIKEMAKGRAETCRLLKSNTQREVTGWVGQRWASELARFDISIIELCSKRDEEMKFVGGIIITKEHLVRCCLRHYLLLQLLTTCLSLKRMGRVKSHQQHQLSTAEFQVPVPSVRRTRYMGYLVCQGAGRKKQSSLESWCLIPVLQKHIITWEVNFIKNWCFPSFWTHLLPQLDWWQVTKSARIMTQW